MTAPMNDLTGFDPAHAAAAQAGGVVPWSVVLFAIAGALIVMCGVAGAMGLLDRLRRPDHPARTARDLRERYPDDHPGWDRLTDALHDLPPYDQEADLYGGITRGEEQAHREFLRRLRPEGGGQR